MDEAAIIARVKAVVGTPELARRLGCTTQAISQWKRVPIRRVLEIEKLTGIPRSELRSDIYPTQAADEAAA